MTGKKLIAVMSALLLPISSFSAAAASYQHGDKVRVTLSECWAFHGGRRPGETSTSNGGNRGNHYNNRLYWYEGYSIDILHTDNLYPPQYNGRTFMYCIHKWQDYGNGERQFYTDSGGHLFDSLYWNSLGREKQRLLQLLSIYGFPARTPEELGAPSVDDTYAACQAIAWEIVTGRRTLNGFTPNYKSSGNEDTPTVARAKDNATYFRDCYMYYPYDGNGHSIGEATPALAAYNKVWADMAKHDTLASFSGQTLKLKWDNTAKAYTGSITDTNGMLANSFLSSSLPSGVSCDISGNNAKFTSMQEISQSVLVEFQKELSELCKSAPFAVLETVDGKPGQEMMSGIMNDPRWFSLHIRTSSGRIDIEKQSADGIVAGMKFRIVGNGIDQAVTTGSNGKVSLSLPAGTFRVFEVDVPDRYETPPEQTITVTEGNTTAVLFRNNYKYGSLKLIKTSEDGKVGGISFRIVGNGVDRVIATQTDGTFLWDSILLPGVYEITEQTDDKYEPQATQRVTVVAGRTSTVTFNNVLKRGTLEVAKTSEDGLKKGMTFRLSGTSLSGLPVEQYAVTGLDGIARFEDVLISGDIPYLLEEVGTPNRYVVPANQTAVIEWNKVTHKSFENVLKKWQAVVTKSDDETGTAQGGASLAGAVYGVFKGEQLIDRYETNAAGQFTTQYYPCGDDWTIRELSPSEGYLLNETIYHVGAQAELYELEYNQTALDVIETVKKGRVALIKHNDDGSTGIEHPEVGAEFQLFLKSAGSYEKAEDSERDLLVCDEHGFARSKDLPYGLYTVVQTKGKEGTALMPAFDVFIQKDGQIYRYLINNATFEALVEIVKKDIETGKVIPAAGIGFKVRDTDTGDYVVQHINYPTPMDIDTFYTDSTGRLMLPEPLPFGHYEILEQCTAYGYVLSSEPVPFAVDGTQTTITVEKHNIAQKGQILVKKSGEVFSSVTETNGLYQPVYAVTGLPGAVYAVYADMDITTPDGTIRAKEGERVGTIETGPGGLGVSAPFYLGRYKLVEEQAPGNMVLNPEPQYVTLEYADQTLEITQAETEFTNERQKVEIMLKKVLKQDETFGLGMNGEILSVRFGLYAAEDLTAADGSTIPADGLLEIVSCDETGKSAFTTDIPAGACLYVKEYSTNEHYQISDEKYPVVFEYADQDVAIVHILVNDGVPIENDLIRGSVLGKKIDEDGFSIGGVLFGLFRPEETTFTEETALLTAESNEIGVFGFFNVPYGHWIVRELKPAPAFVLNETLYPVTISEQEETIEITAENRYITGAVQTTKVDAAYPGNKLSGAVFEVYVDVDGNREFDAAIDRPAGKLAETEPGIYRLDGLRYNGYFLHEAASPEGFLPDEGYYYFEIREDGKTVIVETEAGVGFLNQPVLGNIRILKKDADTGEPLSGVVIGLFDMDGNEVARGVTKSGELLFEGIRYGCYELRELEAKDGYYLLKEPVPVEISEHGQTLTVELTNHKIPEIPQTGDSGTAAGVCLALFGVAGIALALTGRRRRRHS